MPRYFLIYLTGLCLPAFLLWTRLRRHWNPADRKAFALWFWAFIVPCAVVMEYTYLRLDVWTFSEARDPLLGWSLLGAPVEEFVFWFGATSVILLMYLTFENRPEPGRPRA